MAVAVAEFQLLLAQLAGELGSRIDRLVPSLDRLDQPELLSFITDAYPALVTPYIAAGNDLTTVWYDEQPAAPAAKPFYAEPAAVAPVEQLAISARWAMLQSDPTIALKGTATRAVFSGSRDTVITNTTREGILWARHASANACGFCRMLATRGAVYHSQALAKKSHDNCHCLAVPDRDGLYVPAPYVEQWDRDYIQARKDGARTPGQIANAMDKVEGGRRAPSAKKSAPVSPGPPPTAAGGGVVPPVVPPKLPMPPAAGDGWDDFMDHVWLRHAPDALDQEGTKFPPGTTREQVAAMIRDVSDRERVTAPIGPVDPALKARLDAGEATLAEEREHHVNLYGIADGVRYEIRVADADSTAHPIDGKGIVRHKLGKDGTMVETKLPLGRRPVSGWDQPRKR